MRARQRALPLCCTPAREFLKAYAAASELGLPHLCKEDEMAACSVLFLPDLEPALIWAGVLQSGQEKPQGSTVLGKVITCVL